MTDEVRLAKGTLRARIRERRMFTEPEERIRRTAALTGHLVELTYSLGIESLAAYVSTPSEPGTQQFLEFAVAHRIQVIVPISREDGALVWAVWDGEVGDPVDPGALVEVGLILAPAASVDRSGMRMGWGRGYYDRALESMRSTKTKTKTESPTPPVYAVIFDEELVDKLPSEPHDQRVDGVVTPSGTTTFSQ